LDFKQFVYLFGLQCLVLGLETCVRLAKGDAMVSQGFVSDDFRKQVAGFGLTTAHILYRRPDHRWLLQSYVWQAYDLFPEFPELQRFLAFWQEKLEGPLHSVQVAHCKLIKPAELKAINGEFRLH
ncbi:MAG TPA: usg protein, partial [Candidatus Limnocylindrales bacterium]|nr:usg protein [Candidatus Limnocylindrales bacterium]